MFTPLAMQHITLYLIQEEAPDAALSLGRHGVFEPVTDNADEHLPESFDQRYRETFLRAANRLQKIKAHLGITVAAPPAEMARIVPFAELEDIDQRLGALWLACSQREEQLRHVQDELRAVRQLDEALDVFEPLDIDLGRLQEGFRFLDVRIGTVRTEDVSSICEAVGLLGYTLTEFSSDEDETHVLMAGLTDRSEELDRVLGAASFSELGVVAEFGAHPEEIRRDLQERRETLLLERQRKENAKAADRRKYAGPLRDYATALALAAAYAELSKMLRRRGGLTRVTGWVPKDRVPGLREALRRDLGDRFVIEVRDPLPDETLNVPSALRHPRLLKPFVKLVNTYGVPRYGEIDPTWLFAISFIAMFGMMFGDIGHGLVIAIAGFLARRHLYGFAPFVVAIGTSSTIFGFLYGSLFGYEELIHPLWMSPLSDPALMLRLALYWGIAFIVMMTAITIRNRLRENAIAEALLSGGGLAGAAFYFGIIFAAARWFAGGGFTALEAAPVLIPLAVILAYEWTRNSGPVLEKAVIVVIEGFDTLLNYVANTLSFLRVAAFSLNHVALATAVFTLADMLGPTGHWITVVLGNVFILVLEGAIVTIQVLRLEYYEGFSRFFHGDGREFRPLTLGFAAVRSTNDTGAG